ncbi:RHOT1 [Mytilus coruscus]|uniref:RHOT1 n=1 Tax=Mytilus coruscus TaxID=42192 RepID=A0A6J8D906_MYTCO|nr:RHOT1 [Mytilus coruscus]
MSTKSDVRILLLGDPGVGKTSLILTLVSEEFPDEVPAKAEEITIPADVTPERVPTHIVDYSCNTEQDEETLQAEIVKITTFWLPYIRQCRGEEHSNPIILVGNKSDLLDFSTMELTSLCKKALTRIFKICDLDNDHLLNDDEVHLFQRKCFNAPLHQQALDDVKSIVKRNITDGVKENALTLKGFLFLHTLFIQRGRHETTWTVMRAFGYDDRLQLTRDFLYPKIMVGSGSTTELSLQGIQFLKMVFNKYDEDSDGCLSPPELQNLFSTCPVMPWGQDVNNTVCTNPNGWITSQGYLAQWATIEFIYFQVNNTSDVPRTIEFLAYLGYQYLHDSQVSAIQGHLGRNLRYLATLEREHLSTFTINLVQVYGQEKYLMLHEVDVVVSEMLNPTEMNCDVACLLYDVTNPRSFEFCAKMYLKHFIDSRIPVLFVAGKTEYPAVRQDFEMTPAQFCQNLNFHPQKILPV